MLIAAPLCCVKLVVKLKAGEPSGLVRLAVQVPLMLSEFELQLIEQPHLMLGDERNLKDVRPQLAGDKKSLSL